MPGGNRDVVFLADCPAGEFGEVGGGFNGNRLTQGLFQMQTQGLVHLQNDPGASVGRNTEMEKRLFGACGEREKRECGEPDTDQ